MSVMTYVQPRTRNTFGNVALALAALGGVAVAAAILLAPAALYVALPLLATALVLAIIGLTRPFTPKAVAITALVLSVVLAAAAPVVWGVTNTYTRNQR
jgi:hypothetical protein